MTETATAPTPTSAAEREDLITILAKHRDLFLVTVAGLTDDQARLTPTVSALSPGGLVKHVTAMVAQWLDFVEHGAHGGVEIDWENPDPALFGVFANGFRLLPDETLAGVLGDWAAAAERTDALLRTADLDESHPLPAAPWFPPGEAWSNRRVFMHLLAETAQHAGHADILRESIDGQKTMG
ncbi:MAG: DinB family protein [Janthinobacterium lividum]